MTFFSGRNEVKQLRAYRDLLARIYPAKQVQSYILWTDTAQIMQIE